MSPAVCSIVLGISLIVIGAFIPGITGGLFSLFGGLIFGSGLSEVA